MVGGGLIAALFAPLINKYFSYFIFEPLGRHIELADPLRVPIGLVAMLFVSSFVWYLVLSYDDNRKLLASLAKERTLADRYSEKVNQLLYALDWFYNDRSHGNLATPARASSGLMTGGSLWTARAFDRSILYAFVYPILPLLLVWLGADNVDSVGQALGFTKAPQGWLPYAMALFILLAPLTWWVGLGGPNFIVDRLQPRFGKGLAVVRLIIGIVTVAIFMAVAGVLLVTPGTIVVLFAVIALTSSAGGVGSAGVAIVVLGTGVAMIAGLPNFPAIVCALVALFASQSALLYTEVRGRSGYAMAILWTASLAICLVAPDLFPGGDWTAAYPIMLTFGLFSFINAPFDWFALGLTRWFLRRGLESGFRKPWAPLVYAALDIAASLLLMALLAFALVVGTTWLEAATCRAGAIPIPDLRTELSDLVEPMKRWAPKHLWVYVMLWSTQLFAVLNVGIGAWSLLRGLPWINDYVHKGLSPEKISGRARARYALILATQFTLAFVGALAFYIGVVWLLFQHGLGSWLINHLQEFAGSDNLAQQCSVAGTT